MKKRNGFTLIELLAVIVILAVIALIAVPRIIEILNKSRLSAAEDSTYGIVEAAESYIANFMLQNQGTLPSENLIFECNSTGCNLTNELKDYNKENLEELKFKGKKPTSGTITISNGGSNIITTNLNINNFTCLYSKGKSSCIEKQDIKENGTKVYFDPVTGKQCSEDEYDKDQSNIGVKDGCMQWYIFNDNEDSAVYNLILDHNITGTVAWTSSVNNYDGPKDVLEALKEATTAWSDELISPIPYTASLTYAGQEHSYTIDYTTYGNKARLISAEEVVEITKNDRSNGGDYTQADLNWGLGSNWFMLDKATGECHDNASCTKGQSKYSWLFDSTQECINYGCNVVQSGNIGYWTSSAFAGDSSTAWRVTNGGYFGYNYVGDTDRYGVRPVITISKSLIKN